MPCAESGSSSLTDRSTTATRTTSRTCSRRPGSSLGALGIITELTLQCVPAFLLRAREDPGTLSGTLADLDSLVDGTDHFEFYWFPHTDRVLTKRNTRLPVEAGEDPLPGWRSWLDDDLLSNRVFEVVNRVSTARPAWVPRINRITSRVLSSREFTTASHRVFASQRNVRFREMEYAVPRSAAPDLLVALKDLTDRGGLALPFPVEVRFTGADDVWMSTAHGRESAYIAVHQYHRMEHRPYFDAFESMARERRGPTALGQAPRPIARRPPAGVPALRRLRRGPGPGRSRAHVRQRVPRASARRVSLRQG